ncbi:olfactory receptor 1361-like isoform X3 [Hemicordylus capensis]|uniref:olfactory receptor 1361-like isoform X3 n=1 Tax=Hemicordylus capensis TaxID=884348 RepID=UPI002302B795|nr:olfactory receptor 1361-like isoform X3 [Hemicordylus capensis]XP_053157848.1 olfactory receptor 1361-like isoform X3 [Hemicordylus capensis]XP_053157849.1 olfactory receptor 1361-like isoform X3 [Hemicordylus capensis]
MRNQTGFSGFILLGLSVRPEYRGILFPIFLSMYLLTLLGNVLIILLICTDACLLHAPMYFFLSHLSLVDASMASAIAPKILETLGESGSACISYWRCLTQMYFFIAFGNIDSFLLVSRAYDHYVAICHPLHYATIMSHKRCLVLVAGSWGLPNVYCFIHTLLTDQLSFCSSREISNFFCDTYPLLHLSCSDTHLVQMLIYTFGMMLVITPFFCILLSYIHITATVLKVPSAAGKRKAFLTCGTVVTLFYGSIIGVYFQHSSSTSVGKGRVVTIVYTVVTPMLNPFIYSLRNSEIKAATKRLLTTVTSV